MPREACRVRVSREEALALRAVLSLAYNGPIVAREPHLRMLMGRIIEDVLVEDDCPEIIAAAREAHASDKINIDDDAAFSVAAEGVWVGAWVYITNKQAGIDDDDNDADDDGP